MNLIFLHVLLALKVSWLTLKVDSLALKVDSLALKVYLLELKVYWLALNVYWLALRSTGWRCESTGWCWISIQWGGWWGWSACMCCLSCLCWCFQRMNWSVFLHFRACLRLSYDWHILFIWLLVNIDRMNFDFNNSCIRNFWIRFKIYPIINVIVIIFNVFLCRLDILYFCFSAARTF